LLIDLINGNDNNNIFPIQNQEIKLNNINNYSYNNGMGVCEELFKILNNNNNNKPNPIQNNMNYNNFMNYNNNIIRNGNNSNFLNGLNYLNGIGSLFNLPGLDQNNAYSNPNLLSLNTMNDLNLLNSIVFQNNNSKINKNLNLINENTEINKIKHLQQQNVEQTQNLNQPLFNQNPLNKDFLNLNPPNNSKGNEFNNLNESLFLNLLSGVNNVNFNNQLNVNSLIQNQLILNSNQGILNPSMSIPNNQLSTMNLFQNYNNCLINNIPNNIANQNNNINMNNNSNNLLNSINNSNRTNVSEEQKIQNGKIERTNFIDKINEKSIISNPINNIDIDNLSRNNSNSTKGEKDDLKKNPLLKVNMGINKDQTNDSLNKYPNLIHEIGYLMTQNNDYSLKNIPNLQNLHYISEIFNIITSNQEDNNNGNCLENIVDKSNVKEKNKFENREDFGKNNIQVNNLIEILQEDINIVKENHNLQINTKTENLIFENSQNQKMIIDNKDNKDVKNDSKSMLAINDAEKIISFHKTDLKEKIAIDNKEFSVEKKNQNEIISLINQNSPLMNLNNGNLSILKSEEKKDNSSEGININVENFINNQINNLVDNNKNIPNCISNGENQNLDLIQNMLKEYLKNNNSNNINNNELLNILSSQFKNN